MFFFVVLYSYKKGVLNFLDKLCSYYEHEYILDPSVAAQMGHTDKFLNKVYELADENGLSTNAFKSALGEFDTDKMRDHLNKVTAFVSFWIQAFESSQ